MNQIACSSLMLACCAFFFSCSSANQVGQQEKIQSISISAFGGELGYHRSLLITSDSIFYELGSAIDTINNKAVKKRNSQYKLEDIMTTNQLAKFSKITNGQSRQPVDGTDTSITIKTDSTEFKVTNGFKDNLWRSVMGKMNAIIDKEFNETK